ncbi:MAG: glycoside hydrolase family 76 protein [Bacteroidaceae bacterium]
MKFTLLILQSLFITLPFVSSSAADTQQQTITSTLESSKIDWHANASELEQVLVDSFWNKDWHQFDESTTSRGFQYWPQAHAMDVLIDAYDRTGNEKYRTYFDQWYDGIKIGNQGSYFNPYNDDMAWIGITMTKLYQRTHQKKFLDTSLYLWDHIICNWNTQYAGGGVSWKVDMPWAKHACINGPSAVLAMQLYDITKEEKYLDWADKIYLWTRAHLFNRSSGAVYDHINGRTSHLDTRTFTYNQGLFMEAGVLLYQVKQKQFYLHDAIKAANYTMTSPKTIAEYLPVIRNEGAGDAALFKGIFMRYLVDLIQEKDLNPTQRDTFTTFMIYNATVAWKEVSKSKPYLFTSDWQKSAGADTTCNAQVAGSTLIESVCRIL